MPRNERWNIHYSGHVQGVGFRFTAVDLAEGFHEITGQVRNLPDGRVELIAEGPADKLGKFHQAVLDRMNAYISAADLRREPATGEFSGFEIAR